MLFPQVIDIGSAELAFNGFEVKSKVVGPFRFENPQEKTSPLFASRTTELRLAPDRPRSSFVRAMLIHQCSEPCSKFGLISKCIFDFPGLLLRKAVADVIKKCLIIEHGGVTD